LCRPKSKAGFLNSILLMKRLKAFPPTLQLLLPPPPAVLAVLLLLKGWA
jgi:hypothetical protein